MERYTFTLERDGTKITYACEFDTWDQGMEYFVQFLKGCGFYIEPGEWVEFEGEDSANA